jgi:hypothetical protein
MSAAWLFAAARRISLASTTASRRKTSPTLAGRPGAAGRRLPESGPHRFRELLRVFPERRLARSGPRYAHLR